MQTANLLSRRHSFGSSNSMLSSSQLEMDRLTFAFTETATDCRSLVAMTAGTLAYRATKLGILSLRSGQTMPLLTRLLAPVGALTTEVSVFRGMNQILSSHSSSLVSHNSWSTDFVNFASLKVFGRISQRQNLVLSHLLQDMGMLAGHHLAHGLGLAVAPEGSLVQQFVHAEVTNLQMQAGLSLGHHLTGGSVSFLERSWELRSQNLGKSIPGSLERPSSLMLPRFSTQIDQINSRILPAVKRAEQLASLVTALTTLKLTRYFSSVDIYRLGTALEREGLEPVIVPERFTALEVITKPHVRRGKFLRAILQRERLVPEDSTGRAEFVDFSTLKAETDRIAVADAVFSKPWQKVVLREIQAGVLLADCNFGRREAYLHVLDHHGVYGQEKNSAEQMLDLFESTLLVAGGKSALDSPTNAQVEFVIKALNIREISTDNLGDGGWCVWMAQNQRRILQDPALRNLIRAATHFEDFNAFGNNYDRENPAIQLQAALFKRYGDNLRSKEIFGSDRFPPDKARAVVADAMKDISELLDHAALRIEVADEFWHEVDAAREMAQKSIILDRVLEGRHVFTMYDLIPLKPFSIFAQWLSVPDIQRDVSFSNKLPLQATVNPMPAVGGVPRILPIIAVPDGLRLPSGKGLLHLVPVFAEAERKKVEALKAEGKIAQDFKANFWFGKESVILPAPNNGGTFLAPEEIAEIIMREEFALFVEVGSLSH